MFINYSLLCVVVIANVQAQEVRYRQPESSFDHRVEYPVALLKLTLSKIKPSLKAVPSKQPMQQGRALRQLAKGLDVDVVWSGTSKEREEKLRPIRIPLQKGLNGYRLFLVKKLNMV